MAYWWVSHSRGAEKELSGEYLQSGVADVLGRKVPHWETMRAVRAGDVIFSYSHKTIGAVGIATGEATMVRRQSRRVEGMEDAWRVPVHFTPLREGVSFASIQERLSVLAAAKDGPLDHAGSPREGYLFALMPRAGRFLCELFNEREARDVVLDAIIGAPVEAPAIGPTESERDGIVRSRIGQGRFRSSLIEYWGRACAVTSAPTLRLLRASHIKPWCDSNDLERLDVFNGILLSPTYDVAFDAGYITFEEDGRIRISRLLVEQEVERFGFDRAARLRTLDPKHGEYLAYHRSNVFRVE